MINLTSATDTLISLITAFSLGGIIGFERQYRQRTAGLRTNVLVALGAAMFVDMANQLHGNIGAVQVISYIVSGIGFLGAGAIMRDEGNIRGLNTAATLWASAAVGACAGANLYNEAVLSTIFILSANTLLRPIVNTINRKPLDNDSVEVTNTIYLIVRKEWQKEMLKYLETELETMNHPTKDLQLHAFGDNEIEIEATLAATFVNGEELDELIKRLNQHNKVSQAFWSPSSIE